MRLFRSLVAVAIACSLTSFAQGDLGPPDAGLDAELSDSADSRASFDAGSVPEDAVSSPADVSDVADAGVSVEPPLPTTPVPPQPPAAEREPPVYETIVVGTPEARTSGSVHVVKASELERFKRDDPHAVLRAVPGVYAREEDGFGLRPNLGLRGANSDRSKKVTLLEDGVLFGPAPYSAPAAYYFPIIARMESVRVLKGPSAIVHGPHTVGGAVELITRDVPTGDSLLLDVAGGEHLYGKLHARYGAGGERWGFLIEGVHLRNSGFKDLDGGGNTGFFRNEWMLKGRHLLVSNATSKHTLNLKLGYADEVSNETYLGLTDADLRASPQRRYLGSALDQMQWYRTQLELRHTLERGSLTWKTTVYRNDLNRSWRKLNRFRGAALADVLSNPESALNALYYSVLTGAQDASTSDEALMIGPNQRSFVSQGLQSIARWDATTGPLKHHLELGARYHFDSIQRLHSEDAYLVQGRRLILEGSPTLTTADNFDHTHAIALHLVDAVYWGRFALTPGLRTELLWSRAQDRLAGVSVPARNQVLLPGVGLHAALTEELGLFAGVHRGFSPPPPGQPTALPESSVNSEVGARWIRKGERLELIGFFNDYSNLTDICTFSNGCLNEDLDRQFSAGQAFIYGLEAFAQRTFRPLGGLAFPLSAAYTFTRTRLNSSFTSADPQLSEVDAGDELPYVPRHQATVTAGVETLRLSTFVSANYIGPMREVAGQGAYNRSETTDELFTFDWSASFHFSSQARLYFNARNLLNAQRLVSRRPFGARVNAPRMIQLGFAYQL